jgi:hypothetical protein
MTSRTAQAAHPTRHDRQAFSNINTGATDLIVVDYDASQAAWRSVLGIVGKPTTCSNFAMPYGPLCCSAACTLQHGFRTVFKLAAGPTHMGGTMRWT